MTECVNTAGGRAMLYNGDCYGIIPSLPDGSIDLVVTDPPYEFNGQAHGGGMFSAKNAERYGRRREVAMLSELEVLDSVKFSPEAFLDLIRPKMKAFYGYFFCNKTLIADYIGWAKSRRYSYDVLTMQKKNPVPAHSTHHVSDLEYIILIRDKGTYFKGSGLPPDDYKKTFETTCQKRLHPAEKPVELLERFIRVSCPEGGLVLDPFMGSGSTGVSGKYKFDGMVSAVWNADGGLHFYHQTRKICDAVSGGLIRFIPKECFRAEAPLPLEKFDTIIWDEPLYMSEAIGRVRAVEAGLHRRFERVRMAGTIADYYDWQKTKGALRKGEKLTVWKLSWREIKKLLENS